MLVHPLLRRFVVISGGHCTYPTGGPAIRLKNKKKTDEAQKAETIVDRFSAFWLRTICDVLVAFNFAGRDADARRLPKGCGAAFST